MRPDDDDEPGDDEAEAALWPDQDPDWTALLAEDERTREAALAAWLLDDDAEPAPRRVYPFGPSPNYADERAPRHAETVNPRPEYL